ncbi:hypothetical protein LA76x_3413 [Lysobacter antibioticus]|uniref:Uncharacterized protein n=1 Tax=Lysobacter antibioticus TaxID=84531 RepID=A0A0S2FDF9_LYSAN|nr:hypothetical protein LA76x_3413 [Lysobacter antibioticus]
MRRPPGLRSHREIGAAPSFHGNSNSNRLATIAVAVAVAVAVKMLLLLCAVSH